jgi:hypothetical protein
MKTMATSLQCMKLSKHKGDDIMQPNQKNLQAPGKNQKPKYRGQEKSSARNERRFEEPTESRLAVALNERAPELIQGVVSYLETNWGLKKIEKLASAFDLKTMDPRQFTKTASWSGISRRVKAHPGQVAALIAAGVGFIVIARQLINDQDLIPSSLKNSGKSRH